MTYFEVATVIACLAGALTGWWQRPGARLERADRRFARTHRYPS
jgi:hypothetical protein